MTSNALPSPTIPDAHGLYWQIPNYVVDWTNRLILRERQGPDWSFSATLSSFEHLPGDLTDLVELYLKVENVGDALEITIVAGHWNEAAGLSPAWKIQPLRVGLQGPDLAPILAVDHNRFDYTRLRSSWRPGGSVAW